MSETTPTDLDVDATTRDAEKALAAGRLLVADDLCRKVLLAAPDHGPALHVAGLLALRRKHGAGAVELLSRAAAVDTGNPRLLVHLAGALGAVGRGADAVARLQQAIALDPGCDEAHYTLGILYLQEGIPDVALGCLRHAVKLAPDSAPYRLNLGAALQQTGRAGETVAAFAEAARLKPDWALAHGFLADALEATGDFEKAREAAGRALQLQAGHARAEMVLARLDLHDGWFEAARDRLGNVVERTAATPVHEPALNGLGHAFDRLGEYQAAFEAFTKSRQLGARAPLAARFDHDGLVRLLKANREWFSAARTANWPDPPDDGLSAPVFVVGFPRSGAALVERVLAAHPDFVVGHRQGWLARTLAGIGERLPEAFADLEPEDVARLRAAYFEEVRGSLGSAADGRRVVDRNPLNLVYLGAVRRLFPEAKILISLRDPRDTVLACLMGRCPFDRATLHLGDLEALAGFFGRIMELWLHFRQVLGLDLLEVRYEEMVNGHDKAVAELMAFLGAGGVPEGTGTDLYSDGIDRWRKYREPMKAAMPEVSGFVNVLGYGLKHRSQ